MRRSQANDSSAAARAPDNYLSMYGGFGWKVPDRFNMARVCCGRWAENAATAQRVVILADGTDQTARGWTFAELQAASNRLSNALAVLGVQRGDRVAIILPQRFETAVAYMAVLQMGAVAMPLSMLFGPEALEFRLQDSEAVVAICDAAAIGALESVRANCPLLESVIRVGPHASDRNPEYAAVLEQQPASFTPCDTQADEAAVLIYTSGTTGQPKGALIAHRGLIGNLSGFVCSQNWFGFDPARSGSESEAVFWSPADWAWTGGLMDALLPSLYFGRPIVAQRGRFSPEGAFELLERHGVTNTFLFPTALKMMMKHAPEPRARHRLALRAIMSAGETVGETLFDWCRDGLGVPVNEMFGQTEVNYAVGNSVQRWPARPGSIGRAYPGHRVAILGEDGRELPPGQLGEVAVSRLDRHGDPDPVFFLGYWRDPPATRAKFSGDWCRTGDLATADPDGYLWYGGRADDMFKAAGYRIGPGEIESCLLRHPAVANAAVVPKPDPERGNVVKAFIVLAPGHAASPALVELLQQHVRGKLAPYEYPREIEFIDALPMTTTGKVQRRVLREREQQPKG